MEIRDAKYLISSPSVEKCPKPDRPEFAFIGRSNVGKSSLINLLTDKKNLAHISNTPGKTQLINHYDIKTLFFKNKSAKNKQVSWFLVDLPGYGFATVSQKQRKNWEKMIEEYIRNRENLVTLFVLIDSRHKPQKIDIEFINQLGLWKIPFSLVFTKTDKNKPGATKRNVKAFCNELLKTWSELPGCFLTSVVNGEGKKDILEFIGKSL